MKKGHIFFISGIAGSGKGTLIKGLLNDAIPNLKLALSCKTREPRKNEILGVDYNKLTVEEFKKGIESGDFLEYNFVHNQSYYGTRFEDVIENGIDKGLIVIKEMDILILEKVLSNRSEYRDDFTYIFLDMPTEKIKERMLDRGDDITGIDYENRINSAKKEKAMSHLADHIINASGSMDNTLVAVKEIILNKIDTLK